MNVPGPLAPNDAAGNRSRLTFSILALPAEESNFVPGCRSIWVYYPLGLLRRPMSWPEAFGDPVAGPTPVHARVCQEVNPMKETSDLPPLPYPGHSLFQESYFFCKIKDVGDAPAAGDVYVETIVDGYSRLAFAKVYSASNAMNAADLLRTRVLPFFKHYGVAIERVFTRKEAAYCGLAPMHPFETILSHLEY